MCPSHYATEVNEETKDMAVIQVVDISNCREKAAIYKGMATAVLDDVGKQVCPSHPRTFPQSRMK